MGVLEIQREWQSGAFHSTSNGNSHSMRFAVYFDTPEKDLERQAVYARGIPRQGQVHPSDPSIWVVSVSAARVAPLYCEVTVVYGKIDQTDLTSGADPDNNPLNAPEQRSWEFEQSQEPIDRDAAGRPICNSAGQSLDPPVMREVGDPVLTVVRNESAFDEGRAVRYSRATNSDAFFGVEPGHVRCRITGQYVVEGAWTYWRVTYVCRFREDGWKERRVDKGFFSVMKDAAGKPRANSDGSAMLALNQAQGGEGAEFLLDGKGGRLRKGAAPVFLEFDTFKRLPFGPLKLEGRPTAGKSGGKFIGGWIPGS